MPALIRLATLSDVDDLAGLTSQLGYNVEITSLRDRLSRILPRADQQFFVAAVDGRAVGWLHALIVEYIETGAVVTIGGLVVDRDHRGQGMGRALMEHAENWARDRQCSIVRLWSSTPRTDAHKFYEHLGYSNIKTQYSFVKSLAGEEDTSMFVPRIR